MNKLVLGTAQFGMDYGINNPDGRPKKEKSLEMLDFAYKKGINIFDTAYVYGDAEEVLGNFLESRNLSGKIKIITKLNPNIVSKPEEVVYDIIAANLEESLKRLKRTYVDGYLFNTTPTSSFARDKKLVDVFCRLKSQGLIKNIGVSIYEEREMDAIYVANLKEVDYIQVPYNIFDQRMDRFGFFQLAKKNGKTIFTRSAFLQGLFLMDENKIPPHLGGAKKYLRELDNIIGKYGLSRQQAALLFSYKNSSIDYVVFGADNIAQLEQSIDIIKQTIDCEKCIGELKNRFIGIEKNIILPSLWKK